MQKRPHRLVLLQKIVFTFEKLDTGPYGWAARLWRNKCDGAALTETARNVNAVAREIKQRI
jgi:hypothetical protein